MVNRFGLITERKEMLKNSEVKSSLQNACAKIAPLWSLENFVAVNPFWELKHLPFENAAGLLEKTGGAKLTMPFSFYIEKISEGEISNEDLHEALLSDEITASLSVKDFLRQIKLQEKSEYQEQKVNLVVDAASAATGKNWSEFFIERITFWAAAYFDKGQTSWRTSSSEQNIFSSWKI